MFHAVTETNKPKEEQAVAELSGPAAKKPSGAAVVLEFCYAILATVSVVLFGMSAAGMLSEEFASLARTFDYLICLIFVTQASWSLYRAPDKIKWWKWGWADFVASVPEVEILRIFRGLRLFLVVRSIRSMVRGVRGLAQLFDAGRAQTVLALVFSLIVISVLMSSFLILGMESPNPDANIKTARDAFLWSISTLTGAEPTGFGDHFPVTDGGRVVAIWLVIVSLGLIGSLAGLISAWIEDEPEENEQVSKKKEK